MILFWILLINSLSFLILQSMLPRIHINLWFGWRSFCQRHVLIKCITMHASRPIILLLIISSTMLLFWLIIILLSPILLPVLWNIILIRIYFFHALDLKYLRTFSLHFKLWIVYHLIILRLILKWYLLFLKSQCLWL